MIKMVGAKLTLIGHSDNRAEGDTDSVLKDKVRFALNNNLDFIGISFVESAKHINIIRKLVTKMQLSLYLQKESVTNL